MTFFLKIWGPGPFGTSLATPMFTVLVSCSGELAVHSCPLFCLQGQVRIARLAFLGQISEIWPRSKLVGLKCFVWASGLISSWLVLRNSFELLTPFWPFYWEKFYSAGRYYYSIVFGNTFGKCFS